MHDAPAERLRGGSRAVRSTLCGKHERESCDGQRGDDSAPAHAHPQRKSEQNRPADIAEGACNRPPRHVALALLRLEIHQRGLREADEGARSGVPDHQRDEEGPETDRRRSQRGRNGETDPAGDHQRPALWCVADDSDDRVERAPDEARDREHQTDLRICQSEVVANQRPGGRTRTAEHLVEQLDREQERDDAGSSAPAEELGLTRRSSRSHRRNSMPDDHARELVKSLRPRFAISPAP
jgi:hypothetical protein